MQNNYCIQSIQCILQLCIPLGTHDLGFASNVLHQLCYRKAILIQVK